MICPKYKEVIYVDNQEFVNCSQSHELIYCGKTHINCINIDTIITNDNKLQEQLLREK